MRQKKYLGFAHPTTLYYTLNLVYRFARGHILNHSNNKIYTYKRTRIYKSPIVSCRLI